jgi:hypothetical protein
MLKGGKLHIAAAVLLDKEPSVPWSRGMFGPQNRSGHFGKTENRLFLPGIKPNFPCFPCRRLVIIRNTPYSGLIIFSPIMAGFPLRSTFLLFFHPLLRFPVVVFTNNILHASLLFFIPVTFRACHSLMCFVIEVTETLLLKSVIIIIIIISRMSSVMCI